MKIIIGFIFFISINLKSISQPLKLKRLIKTEPDSTSSLFNTKKNKIGIEFNIPLLILVYNGLYLNGAISYFIPKKNIELQIPLTAYSNIKNFGYINSDFKFRYYVNTLIHKNPNNKLKKSRQYKKPFFVEAFIRHEYYEDYYTVNNGFPEYIIEKFNEKGINIGLGLGLGWRVFSSGKIKLYYGQNLSFGRYLFNHKMNKRLLVANVLSNNNIIIDLNFLNFGVIL